MWKTFLARIIPYDSKIRVFIKIALQLIRHPRQLIYYMRPEKIARVFYYFRHGGVNQVARILDERILMGGNLKLEIHVDKLIQGSSPLNFPPLVFKKESQPLVSIIIPAFNQFSYTYNCLRSVWKNSGEVPYEIILADDCSTDLTCQIETIVKNIRVIRTPENYRFLRNCNYAAKEACGKYLLFLNNDTQVQLNWLMPLVSLLEKNPQAGMTGSKLIYPDGRLQEAGGILWKDGSAWNFGNGKNPALPEYCYVKEADYISGAAIMIRRSLWEQIGGFDVRYSPAYCEDSDLAFEVRKAGYHVLFQPKSVVVHFEGRSNGTDTSSGLKSYQIINQEKFFEKWKHILEIEHFANGEDVFLARDHSQGNKKMLVIDHMVPKYDKDAGAKNVYMYTKMFIEMGLRVTFLPADFFPYQPYTEELEQLGIEVLYGNYYFKYWKEWLIENGHYFDYIYVNRPHIAIRFMDLLKQYTKGKIIYFGHDLHYLREQREYELKKDPEILKSSQKWKDIEFRLIDAADVVYVVGDYEKNVLQDRFPGKQIRNIPIFIYPSIREKRCFSIGERKDLMFVGGFNHPPNIDAVLWFAKEVFPIILKNHPNIHWYIIGSNPPDEILALADENIIVTGFVSDEELEHYYQNCRLAVVPLRYGAGVKGKVIEAIYHQCPLLTTSIGAEGISTTEGAFEIASADQSMAYTILSLYDDEKRLRNIADKCAAYINKHFTSEQALSVLHSDIRA